MIFRRRTTDQVYATLQQVQRRITEQGAGVPAPAATPRAPGTASFRPGATATPMRTPSAGTLMPGTGATRRDTPSPVDTFMPQTAPVAVTAAITPSHGGRGVLELPTQLAVTLMLVWLMTLVATFMMGRWSAPTSTEVTAAPVATVAGTKPQDPEAPAKGKRLGDSIFVLRSLPRFTDKEKADYQKLATRLNGLCRDNAAKGWKDYFTVREPENGGLELVFGYANGQYGIDRQQFRDFAAMLQRPTEKGGGGYVAAVWKSVE